MDKHQHQHIQAITSETRQFIEERISDIEKDLVMTEENLRSFREQNRIISNSPNLLLMEDRYVREVEVLKNLFITLKNQLELVKVQEVENKNSKRKRVKK